MKISLKFLSILIVALGLIALPACKRTALKPLPPIPAKAEKTDLIHVESHLLTHDECKDYLGLSFNKKSAMQAWHIIIYNSTEQSIYLHPDSWSLAPYSLMSIKPVIKNRYNPSMVLGAIAGGGACLGLTAASAYCFCGALAVGMLGFASASNTWLFASVATGLSSVATLISTPFVIYYAIEADATKHLHAVADQLMPDYYSLSSNSARQGIVLLPNQSVLEPWSITLFNEQHEQLCTKIINS